MIRLHAVDWAFIFKKFAEHLRRTGSEEVSGAIDDVGNLLSKYAVPMYNQGSYKRTGADGEEEEFEDYLP